MEFIHRLDSFRVKKHTIISAIGLTLGLLLYAYFQSAYTPDEPISYIEAALAALTGILTAYVCFGISRLLDRWLPWSTHLAARILAGLVLEFITAVLIISLAYFAYTGFTLGDDKEFWMNGLIKLSILVFLVVLIYNIIYFALYSYYTYSKLQIEEVAYERKQIELQLKALKSQLSSHFLFNNLNTISALAFKDSSATEAYVRGLADVYRYSLKSYETRTVSIEEELAMLQSYLLLLKTRYQAHFDYHLDVSPEITEMKIPPLTLQMLVENAVKHNVMDHENSLEVKIYSNDKTLTVTNNITRSPNRVSSFQIGLSNIKARYEMLQRKGISIVKDTHFTVTIPVIE